jgi:ferredoxin-NADP reductase
MTAYRLLEIEHLTKRTFRLRTERPDCPIKAGQCFNLGLPGMGINREYSMYSGADAPYLDFLIRAIDGGLVSSQLQNARIGDLIEIDGPYGEFCLRAPVDTTAKHLFVATGTGIAPFHSFVTTFPNLVYIMLHGVRAENERYHAQDYANGNYIGCISRPSDGSPAQRVTDYLAVHPILPDTIVYLCGNKNMIIEVYELFSKQGIYSSQILTEVFF